MALELTLRKAIIEFLLGIPYLHDKEGRKAILYSAGLSHVMPDVDLSGIPREVITALLEQLENAGKLDGQFVLIRFLEEAKSLVGQEGQARLQEFCDQLPNQLPVTPRPVFRRPPTYLAPFQAPPLPQHFVPRPEVTDLLKARLLNEDPKTPGILVVSAIHGLGGIGKSTLAAALAHDKEIQARFPDGIFWATLGQQPEILSLISGWIQALRDYDFRPTTVEAASNHLRTLLQDKAVLLVVDDVWQPEHANHLKVGGPRCQVLMTTREAIVAKAVDADLYNVDVMNQEQALTLLSSRLKRELRGEEEDQARELSKEVGYLPLALELSAAQIADRVSWTELLEELQTEIASLSALEMPEVEEIRDEALLKKLSLRASFTLSLRRLSEENLTRFMWLGILPEDVTISATMTATLWQTTTRQARDTLRYLYDKALLLPGSPIIIGEKEWSAYRLHDLLHDMACNLLTTPQPQGQGRTVPEAHAALLEQYKACTRNGLWHTLPDDGYIHAHLTWHLQKAGQIEQIHALLREETAEGRHGWYQARERLGQTAGFLEDINLAMQIAKQEHNIGLQCRYVLIVASFNSLAQNISPSLLVALVEKGVWTPTQGLAYAYKVIEAKQRADTLIGLISHLSESLKADALQEALIATKAIKEEKCEDHQNQTLVRLAPYLPASLLQEALGIAIQVVDSDPWCYEWWNEASEGITHRIVELGVSNVLFKTMQEIENEGKRAYILSKIAAHLPESLVREALEVAQVMKDTKSQVKVLEVLAPHLPESLLKEALTTAQAMKDTKSQADALEALAPHLPESLLKEALTTAQAMKDTKSQAIVLGALAPRLPESLLKEALTTAQAIDNEWDRGRALSRLAPHLLEPLLKEAFVTAQIIEKEWIRVKALIWLAPHLPPLLLQETLATIQTIENANIQSWAMMSLVPHLPDPLLLEAITTIQMIEDQWNLNRRLMGLNPHLPGALFWNALVIADENKWYGWWAEALTKLIPYLSGPLLHGALAAAQEVKDERIPGGFELDERIRVKLLTELIPHLQGTLKDQKLKEAVEMIPALEGDRHLFILLKTLAPYFSEHLRQEALAAVQKIKDKYARVRALAALGPYLSECMLQEALAVVQTIEEQWNRDGALRELVPYLTSEVLLREALTIDWDDVLFPHFPETLLREKLGTIRELEDEKVQARQVSKLAPYLSEPLLQEALIVVQGIKNNGYKFNALIQLASYLTEALLQEAVLIAWAIEKAGIRAEVLLRLVPYLSPPSKEQALCETVIAIQSLEDANIHYYVDRNSIRYDIQDYLWETFTSRLVELKNPEEALTVARIIKNGSRGAWALLKLIPELPDSLREQIVN